MVTVHDARNAVLRAVAVLLIVCSCPLPHALFGQPPGFGGPYQPGPRDDGRYPLGPDSPRSNPLPAPGVSNPNGPGRLPEEGPVPEDLGPARPRGSRIVAGVRITGNTSVPTHRIHAQLSTRKDRKFVPQWLEHDKRNLLDMGLFQDVKISTQQTPGGVVVTFQVFERQTIKYIKIIGNRRMTDDWLLKEIGLKEGDPLNVYRVREAIHAIEEYYLTNGLPNTQATILKGDKPGDDGIVILVSEDQEQHIWRVEFIGNKVALDGRLLTQIKSQPPILKLWFLGGTINRQTIDEDVQRLTAYYRGLGYFNAKVGRELRYNSAGTWAALIFYINEGPRYVVRNVSVVGNRKFRSDEMLGQLDLKPGEHFNATKMGIDVNTLRELYGSQGHIFADIQAEPRFLEEPGELDLVYNISEGAQYRVGKIRVHIEGPYAHTRESVVMNRLSLVPGDIIDIREVRASERRLKASQLFLNEPHRGVAPRVVVRPPDVSNLARRTNFRGQSPDESNGNPRVRKVDLHVYARSNGTADLVR